MTCTQRYPRAEAHHSLWQEGLIQPQPRAGPGGRGWWVSVDHSLDVTAGLIDRHVQVDLREDLALPGDLDPCRVDGDQHLLGDHAFALRGRRRQKPIARQSGRHVAIVVGDPTPLVKLLAGRDDRSSEHWSVHEISPSITLT